MSHQKSIKKKKTTYFFEKNLLYAKKHKDFEGPIEECRQIKFATFSFINISINNNWLSFGELTIHLRNF